MSCVATQVQVHAEPLKRRFVADCWSVACLLNLVIVAGAAILPLYVAFTSGLWLREVVRHEQLDLTFRSALVVQLQGLSGPAGGYRAPFTAMWTTSPAANDLLGADVVRGVIVRSSFEDTNLDGTRDVLRVSASVPLAPGETIHSATLLAYFDVKLHDVTRLDMDGVLAVGGHGGGLPGSRLVLDGDVTLAQRDTLAATPEGVYAPYLGRDALQPLASALSARAASPEGILESVAARNFSLAWTPSVTGGASPIWVPDTWVPGGPGIVAMDVSPLTTEARSFTIKLTARVPVAPIRIKPSIPEELKHGWVQYVALLTVSSAVAWVIQRVLFGLRIVETRVLVDAPHGGTKLHRS